MQKRRNVSNILYFLIFFISPAFASEKPIEFFISPYGNDANAGTKAKPFQTVDRARKAVRLQLQKNPGKSIAVIIQGGVYYLEKPIEFKTEDSGTEDARVVYKAADGEKPVFTGSKPIKHWQLLKDIEKIKILSPAVKGKVFVANLKAFGISNFGDPAQIGMRPELFCNGEMQTLARWPNEGFVKAGITKGRTESPPTYIEKHGTVEGVFEYLDSYQNRWTSEKDLRLGGYWYWDWSDEFQQVEKIDTVSKTVYLKEPYHHYGYRDSLRYFGLNLFCEIDSPGEWYLDRTEGLLYWFPPVGINPDKVNTTFSIFSEPFMVEMKNCSNVSIEGLTFREGRGSAININNGRNCLISACKIERFGKDGIHIEEGKGHGVSGCLLQYFGCRGIQVKGGDRKTLIPSGHFVENTIVEHFSLYKRTYEPAIYLDGCGMRINNNRLSYSSSSAFRLEGNDFIIEYNEISHVVNESDDQGGIDIYNNPSYRGIVIRYNHWYNIKGGTRHGAAGIRLDDMISGVTIYGNIFERCGAIHFGAVQIHGGKDNVVENNLFYNCNAAVSFTKWREDRWLQELDKPGMRKKLYEDVNINTILYQNKYPELKNINTAINVNTVKNNLAINCQQLFLGNDKYDILENNSFITSGGKEIEEFYTPVVLKNYNMHPIPVIDIGPQNNIWINKNK